MGEGEGLEEVKKYSKNDGVISNTREQFERILSQICDNLSTKIIKFSNQF
jgi:hypothetical protein